LRATSLVYSAYGKPLIERGSFPLPDGGASCALCRRQLRRGDEVLPVKNVIRRTFTNRDLLNPASKYVCAACAFCLRTPELRRRDFVATPRKIEFLTREELRSRLLKPVRGGEPFVFCVGLSHKKHLVIRARVNLNPKIFYVQFEEQGVWVQPAEHETLLFSIQAMREKGLKKVEIGTGLYEPARLNPDILRLERIVKPYRGSGIFRLMLHAS